MNKIFLLSSILISFNIIRCQEDSISLKKYEKINWTAENNLFKKPKLFKKIIAPTALAVISISLNTIETKTYIQNQIRKPFNGYTTSLDDYLQYMPIVELYTFDLCKFKAQNSIWNQTKYLAISEIITCGIVQSLKYSLKIQRPNNGSFNSFPSGHTSQSFVGSQVLFNEYYQSNKLIAFSGLAFSISTAGLRVVNNQHWLPDVLMGAGIGILVTNIVYHFEPLKNWNPWNKKKCQLLKTERKRRKYSTSFYPTFRENYMGINLKIRG
ncbi:MAG: phosphatase PAP2 family protein [Bacteroidota bacterium]